MFKRFIITLFLILSATNTIAAPSTNTNFTRLANAYLDTYYFPFNPTTATLSGIHTYDNQLEDYSKAGINRTVAMLKKFDARLNKINPAQLDEHTQGDYALVRNDIRSQLLTLQTIRPWEKNPDVYSSGITMSAFVLIERQFAPANDRLRALIAREKLMPAVLQAARDNLVKPSLLFTRILH